MRTSILSCCLVFLLSLALKAAEPETCTVFLDELDLTQTRSGWKQTIANKSIDGNPLSIGGKKFERGLGHHSPGEILIELPKADGRFTARVGIDDEVGGKGHAEFIVFLDNRILWRSGFMTGGQEAKSIDLPIWSGYRHLRLVVEAGPEGYAHDHADWADAKFEFKTKQTAEAIRANTKTLQSNAVIFDEEGNLLDRLDENACEFASLTKELKTGIDPKRVAQAKRPDAAFLETDRDPVDVVLRRTRALLGHLKTLPGAPDFGTEIAEIDKLDARNKETPVADLSKRKSLFADVAALRRQVALKNPLLDFSDIIFIKRHVTPEPEHQGNHMVDQFFGFHAVPGGGLFVLKNAFDPDCDPGKRKVENLLEKEQKNGWGFLSPELSYDGRTILFAATDTSEPRHSYTWTPNNCYHLFSVSVDGTGLKQLTEGSWNDIDPCFLPNGRIVFISERRGGFGRCHSRPCPTYTLHSMLPDGGDITMLSPHETNEWAPMVDRNGMIVYTRWDYIDRGFNQAHHPWITFPDGRDPRAIQGNYSEEERSRPHFETSLRPVPNSHKLIGTAQGHHTQYFGSVILLDPNVPDDEEGGDPMAPLKRVTPEQPFPEVENASHRDPANYGQPFPISEDYFLVVYDAFSGMGKGHANNYGLYLLDSFGNKVLLYRDPAISCQCPIAVKSRPVPPSIPHQTAIGLPPGVEANTTFADGKLPKTAEVGVVNVYETNRPFPEGTKIKELRIVQVLPKTTPDANVPWIGYGNETGARKVLGTVPVEADGSVRFDMPVDVPVYFQALDEDGVAVQTMRSATYVKPGETLTCLGCHEGRQRSTAKYASYPTAFRKPAQAIQPDVTGSNPFNFPLLVQPILDRHCVDCHEKEAAVGKAFRLGRGEASDLPTSNPKRHFFESYVNLRPYVFVFKGINQKASPELMNPLPSNGGAWNSFTTARTFPGKFGANASPLWQLLKKGHYDVSLNPSEYRAIALWLDNNADFYGAFELESLDAQRRGDVVRPTLE